MQSLQAPCECEKQNQAEEWNLDFPKNPKSPDSALAKTPIVVVPEFW